MKIHPESRRQFPWLANEFPTELLSEERARKFHDQTLARLDVRGGMSVGEILLNLEIFSEWQDYTTAIGKGQNAEPAWMARVLDMLMKIVDATKRMIVPDKPVPTTNTHGFAASELAILSRLSTDPDDRPVIEPFYPEILALCEAFGKSGQSGGSAGFVARALSSALRKLLLQKSITPITGEDQEWVDPGIGPFLQNARCGELFKIIDPNSPFAGRAYYLDAIVMEEMGKGNGTSGGHVVLPDGSGRIMGRAFVRQFPYEPHVFKFLVGVNADDERCILPTPQNIDTMRAFYEVYEPIILEEWQAEHDRMYPNKPSKSHDNGKEEITTTPSPD